MPTRDPISEDPKEAPITDSITEGCNEDPKKDPITEDLKEDSLLRTLGRILSLRTLKRPYH